MNNDNYKVRRALRLGAALVFLAVTTTVTAGTFTISPIRVELEKGHTTEVLTVRNEEDAPLLIQAKAVAWSQENGEEHYTDTRDLLLTPPVFQLAPKAEQIVRVALRNGAAGGNVSGNRELQYRLILTEVPQPAAEKFVGLKVALSMSIPVFVMPSTALAPEMKWKAKWLADGSLQVFASNQGNAHLQVFDFDVQSGSRVVSHAAVSRYVLPGSEIVWTLTAPKDAPRDADTFVHGASDHGEFRATVVHEGL